MRWALQHVSPPKGVQLRIIRIKMVRGMQPHRTGCKPNPTSNVKVVPPMCYKCRGWGCISCNCPGTQNYTKQGQVKDNLNSQLGGAEPSPTPREQPHMQSARICQCKPVRFNRAPKYHNLDPVLQLICPHMRPRVEANGVSTYALIAIQGYK